MVNTRLLHREVAMSPSDGVSDDEMPVTLPTEEGGRLNASIRKVRHLKVIQLHDGIHLISL